MAASTELSSLEIVRETVGAVVATPGRPPAPARRASGSELPATTLEAVAVEWSGADRRLALLNDPRSEAAAAYRVLGHRLAGRVGVVAVTSAERAAGKTSCALNLSLALSECGRGRVLLVEANLRRPALAALLSVLPPRCFSEELLRHRVQPAAPWLAARLSEHLHLLAVDRLTFKPPRVLDGPALEQGLGQLAQLVPEQYDQLVIDTPPVLGHADVNLIQSHADGVVLVARRGRTRRADLRRALEQLGRDKILGVALVVA